MITVIQDRRGPHRRWMERTITLAADHLRAGSPEDTISVLAQLAIVPDAEDYGVRSATELLLGSAAAMLCSLAEQEGHRPMFGVRLTDGDESEILIDEVDPPMRAMIRALLADANGDWEAADMQLDLAFLSDDDTVRTMLVLHALVWAVGLAGTCESRGLGFPAWLRGSSAHR